MRWLVLGFVLLVGALVFLSVTALGAVVTRRDYSQPAAVSLPEGVSFDVVLLQYATDSPTADAAAARRQGEVLRVLRGGRVVSYPSSYTPVLVPASEVGRVRELLGDRLLVLSPSIEVNP